MKSAVEFAKEMLRKEDAIRRTKSKHLKWQYRRNLKKAREELYFYCRCKNLKVSEVFELASK